MNSKEDMYLRKNNEEKNVPDFHLLDFYFARNESKISKPVDKFFAEHYK